MIAAVKALTCVEVSIFQEKDDRLKIHLRVVAVLNENHDSHLWRMISASSVHQHPIEHRAYRPRKVY